MMTIRLYNRIVRLFWIGVSCAFIQSASVIASSNPEGIQLYSKSHLTAEKRQSLAEDIDRYNNAENLWDVMRREFSLPHYEDNPQVQEQIDWYMNHKDYVYEAASRAAPYLYYILQQVRKRNLPVEVALLPVFESAFNPFAYSNAGAAGIWQMMPGTASGYGLKQTASYDGRRDVISSTKAALNHLAYLGNFFEGNWLLAFAAYDTGEGNVLAAIRKNIRLGERTDYWSLPLVRETRDYLPKLLAIAIIISQPDKYPMDLPFVRNAPYLAQVDLGSQIDLKRAAVMAGIPLKKMIHLNSGYSKASMGAGPNKLVLPIENVAQFMENLEQTPMYQHIRWLRYRVQSNDTLASIAKKYKTTPDEIRKLNPTLADNLKRGTRLVIPQSVGSYNKTTEEPQLASTIRTQPFTEKSSTKSTPAIVTITAELDKLKGNYKLQSGDTIYMVRQGDDLEKIAKRFHLPTEALEKVNSISRSTVLSVGKKLTIPTHFTKGKSTIQQYQISPGDTVYMVKKGDTIEKIARKYKTTPAAIRVSNLMASNEINPGDRLVIPTHVG